MPIKIRKCPIHNVELIERRGISNKTNRPYHFWSCSQKDENGNWCKYTEREPSGAEQRHKELKEALKIINDNIKKINSKLEILLEIKRGLND